jgi:hypothetical protein
MSAYTDAVEQELKGLEHISIGYLPYEVCNECPEDQNEDCGDEGHFSWSACGSCGSTLGGTRYTAHAKDNDGRLYHFDVCEDCVQYLTYGDEPEHWEGAAA